MKALSNGFVSSVLAGATVLGLACGPAAAAARWSAVYCRRGADNSQLVFAARVQRDGRLRFGIDVWDERQHNLVIYGLARRAGELWTYADHMDAADRCRLDIRVSPDGAAHIVGDPEADCSDRGGAGTAIGFIDFPKSDDEGPVTFELNTGEIFANKAGKC